MRTFTLNQQRKNRKTVDTLYEIQPTGPARRLATQQVGLRPNKETQPWRRKLQPGSQYHFLVSAR